ncbi:MAG: flagellar hook-length control protein FliK [Aquabacterium sp.]|jgi:flagellar hook-length control protein FliK|uniref:flagellar hook-length control protein FliK n=1 Tax=Aquabacterium sp. TaxID=1872578 RepID=UPI003BB151A6
MSTSFQNLPSLLNKPGTQSQGAASGVGGATLADVLGKGQGNDSQTFAKLMSQYQTPQASAQASLPMAAANQQANLAANQALRAKAAVHNTTQLQPKPPQSAPKPAQNESQASASQQAAKQAQKNNQAKTAQDQRAKAKQADDTDKAEARVDKTGKADRTQAKGDAKEQGADEVKFSTAQGEGAAQVRELQPPAGVSSDPAAMMAWLSTLSQGGEAAQGLDADGALTDGAATAAGTAQAPDLQGAAGGKGASLPTATAALTTQLLGQQSGKVDPKALVSESQGAVAALAAQDKASPLDFNALMAREMSRPAGPSGAVATHASATLPTPVDSPDFKQALAERVGMWVAGTPANGQMTAELRLNPEDMGPVHIRIVMDGQNAQVDFAAAHAETRQALEASLPALSSALEDAGLSLAGGGVSDQSASQSWAQQQQGQGDGQARSMAWSGRGLVAEQAGVDAQASLQPVPRPAARPGGLDLYA